MNNNIQSTGNISGDSTTNPQNLQNDLLINGGSADIQGSNAPQGNILLSSNVVVSKNIQQNTNKFGTLDVFIIISLSIFLIGVFYAAHRLDKKQFNKKA